MSHSPARTRRAGQRPIRVLVVDDSALARNAITAMLSDDPALRVLGSARNGEEALQLASLLPVEVVTLDLEMPGLGGLETLKRLRDEHKVPVVVLSGAAAASAALTMQALDLGAFDVVAKPLNSQDLSIVSAELRAKVRVAAGLDDPRSPGGPSAPSAPLEVRRLANVELVVIGISTGGPKALQELLPGLPADFPVPIVVMQHMPPGYTHALAEHLDKLSALRVKEAEHGERLAPGRVLIAPSGKQLSFCRDAAGARVEVLDECPFPTLYRPCVDFSFIEAARHFPGSLLGIVMTGMGADGAKGVAAIRQAAGTCWAQDEASCTIYGMPKAAIATGLVEAVVPLKDLAPRLLRAFGASSATSGSDGAT